MSKLWNVVWMLLWAETVSRSSPKKTRHGTLIPNPLRTSVSGDLTVRPERISCSRSPCLLHADRLRPAPSELHPMWGDVWQHASNIRKRNDIKPTHLSFSGCLEIHSRRINSDRKRAAPETRESVHGFYMISRRVQVASRESTAQSGQPRCLISDTVWRGGPSIPPRHACHRPLQMWVT